MQAVGIVGSVLFGLGCASVSFDAQELLSTQFTAAITIGTDSTSISVTSPNATWQGVGFGGLTMTDAVEAVVFEGSNFSPATILMGAGNSSFVKSNGGNYRSDLRGMWTVSDFSRVDGVVSYVMTRANDVSDICAECYTFDPSSEGMAIIMARGQSGIAYGPHLAADATGYFLGVSAEPSYSPTTNPSMDPTMQPTTYAPTTNPSVDPTYGPTIDPTVNPSSEPSTYAPTANPTADPSNLPSHQQMTSAPSTEPTTEPTIQPSNAVDDGGSDSGNGANRKLSALGLVLAVFGCVALMN